MQGRKKHNWLAAGPGWLELPQAQDHFRRMEADAWRNPRMVDWMYRQ